MGIYINNAKKLILNQVSIQGNEGEAFDLHNIDSLVRDGEERGKIQ